jgi:hypothetical protein
MTALSTAAATAYLQAAVAAARKAAAAVVKPETAVSGPRPSGFGRPERKRRKIEIRSKS